MTKNGVQFVEFCSLLNKNDKYGYKKFSNITDENEYIALGCECLDDEILNLDVISSNHKCGHSVIINDNILIQFL